MQNINQQKDRDREQRIRINFQIRIPQVRVIASNGDNLGVMQTRDALKLAQDENLDLVEINPRSSPPIVKIIDFGEFKYQQKKQAQATKKNQQNQEMKEITFKPNTDLNDLNHKIVQIKEFLKDNFKVRLSARFRGREIVHPHVGREKIEYILSELSGLIVANPIISLDGKIMSTTVFPVKLPK